MIANLAKFTHGGWITLLIGVLLISVFYIWYAGKRLKSRYKKFVPLKKHLPLLKQLSEDTTVPRHSTHLVYFTLSAKPSSIEERSLKSIFLHQPKRADTYWFVHVDVDDAPYTLRYHTDIVSPDNVIYVRFQLGFRVVPRINLLFRQVVENLVQTGQVKIEDGYRLSDKHSFTGDFRFVLIKSILSVENNLSFRDNFIMRAFFLLDYLSQSEESTFGLDDSSVLVEKHPLVMGPVARYELEEEK